MVSKSDLHIGGMKMDGVFLHRPELRQHWDYTIFVDAGFDATMPRACKRDRHLFHSADNTRKIYARRYIPAQKWYLAAHRAHDKADAVFRNDDIKNPALVIR